jgi:hypothetical protein
MNESREMLDLAAKLALRAAGDVEPNPLVGAVIVAPGAGPAESRIIGMGHHEYFGVKHAEAMDLWQAAAEVARVSGAARDNKATRDELSGSTITITSLGPIGGVVTTPVINHPDVAIIGPNAIIDRPVDGYDAAQFIQRVKALLEHPALMFM